MKQKHMLKIVLMRFLKGFLAGGISQVAMIVGAGLQFHNLKEIGAIGVILVSGFVTGGLLGAEKALNYTDPLNSPNQPPL